MNKIRDRVGPVTPNKIVSLTLLFAGIFSLAAARFVPSFDGGLWSGIALTLLALSFFVDGLFPGGSEFDDQQIVFMKHYGIPYRPGGEKLFSLGVGTLLLLPGLYLLATNS